MCGGGGGGETRRKYPSASSTEIDLRPILLQCGERGCFRVNIVPCVILSSVARPCAWGGTLDVSCCLNIHV